MVRVRKEGMLALVCGAAFVLSGCSSLPDRSPAQIAADAATAGRVYAALDDDPIYFFRHVDVTVDDGVARLSGIVWTTDALFQAQKIARAVPGVTAVDDELELARAARRGGGDGGG
jgi:osmotically-inducible protein OsmY